MPQKLDFKAIAESVDIYAVANHLGLKVVKGRAHCPACDTDRAIEIKPETNTFVCYAGDPRPGCEYLSGDCIALYAHIKVVGQYQAAKALSKLFADATAPRPAQPTAPQKPEGASSPSASTAAAPARKESGPFDPDKYAASLVYDDRVKAIGLSEETAALYRVGTKRGKLYIPVCPPDVTPAGFVEYHEGNLKLPDTWLARNVVRLRRA